MSCLMVAAFLGHAEYLPPAHSGRCRPGNARAARVQHPLPIAAQSGHEEACQVLLAAGANPNAIDSGEGNTPLLLAAAENGHSQSLCPAADEAGAEVDARNCAGDNAAALALARQGHGPAGTSGHAPAGFCGEVEAILGRAVHRTSGQGLRWAVLLPSGNSSPPGSTFAFCPHCGSALPGGSGVPGVNTIPGGNSIPGGAAFCPNCGGYALELRLLLLMDLLHMDLLRMDLLRVFHAPPRRHATSPLVGGLSHGNYSHVFFQFEAAGAKEGKRAKWVPTFNWSAFLLGPLWYLLKGMWVKAVLFTVVSLLLGGRDRRSVGACGLAVLRSFSATGTCTCGRNTETRAGSKNQEEPPNVRGEAAENKKAL